ncbi:hypothetical protein GCM10009609_62350 [Pseudonocardia aurantiaca]
MKEHEREIPPTTRTTSRSTPIAAIMSRTVRAERGGFDGGPGAVLTRSMVQHVRTVSAAAGLRAHYEAD